MAHGIAGDGFRIEILDDGRARVHTKGHVGEGRLVMQHDRTVDDSAEYEIQFDGELVCGPHDADGRHVDAEGRPR